MADWSSAGISHDGKEAFCSPVANTQDNRSFVGKAATHKAWASSLRARVHLHCHRQVKPLVGRAKFSVSMDGRQHAQLPW